MLSPLAAVAAATGPQQALLAPTASPVRPLRIVLGLINHTGAISAGAHDPRAVVFDGVARVLSARGHTVDVMYSYGQCFASGDAAFQAGRAGKPPADVGVAPWFCPRPDPTALPTSAPLLVYENGFTKGSVTVDPSGLLGDSLYVPTLNDEVQAAHDDAACAAFVAAQVVVGSSKRPQSKLNASTALPSSVVGRYIFVPTQKMADLSVTNYSNTTMVELIDAAIIFARDNGLPVVFKVHPALFNSSAESTQPQPQQPQSEGDTQEALIGQLASAHGYDGPTQTLISRADIDYLTRGARFTATINGGTLFDNFHTQTPVLSVGHSLFWRTDALVYDGDVQRGLRSMLDTPEWGEGRRSRQRQMVCWYRNHSLNEAQTAEENVAVLQAHLARVAPGLQL